MTSTPSGPFETRDDANNLPAVRAAHAAFDANPQPGRLTDESYKILRTALANARVDLGTYDNHLVKWLADDGPRVCAVISDWIHRATLPDSRSMPDRLREIADIDIGFNSPGIADDLKALADRLETVMSGSDAEAQRAEFGAHLETVEYSSVCCRAVIFIVGGGQQCSKCEKPCEGETTVHPPTRPVESEVNLDA